MKEINAEQKIGKGKASRMEIIEIEERKKSIRKWEGQSAAPTMTN